MDGQKKSPYNSTYPNGVVSYSKDSFTGNQTVVFQIKCCRQVGRSVAKNANFL